MARHFTHIYIWYSFYFITTILVQPCHLTELAPLRPHIGVFTKCMVRVSICVEFGAKRMTTSCRAPVYLCSFCQECRFSQCPQMDRAWMNSLVNINSIAGCPNQLVSWRDIADAKWCTLTWDLYRLVITTQCLKWSMVSCCWLLDAQQTHRDGIRPLPRTPAFVDFVGYLQSRLL